MYKYKVKDENDTLYKKPVLPKQDIIFKSRISFFMLLRKGVWGPASQPGVILNFLDSSRFTFLFAMKPAHMKEVQCAGFFYLSKSVLIF